MKPLVPILLKDVHSFFGNLKNGGMYEGIWGNVTDDNRVWIGSRNGITFGRWDNNNLMVLAAKPLEENRYDVVAGRMGTGCDDQPISGGRLPQTSPEPFRQVSSSAELQQELPARS